MACWHFEQWEKWREKMRTDRRREWETGKGEGRRRWEVEGEGTGLEAWQADNNKKAAAHTCPQLPALLPVSVSMSLSNEMKWKVKEGRWEGKWKQEDSGGQTVLMDCAGVMRGKEKWAQTWNRAGSRIEMSWPAAETFRNLASDSLKWLANNNVPL